MKRTSVLRTQPLASYISDCVESWNSPFRAPSPILGALAALAGKFVGSLEELMGARLHVEKPALSVPWLPPRFEKLIRELERDDAIDEAGPMEPVPGWPRFPTVYIKSGRTTSTGIGTTWDEAATKAAAEFLERSSLTELPGFFTRRSWRELTSNKAVDPAAFASLPDTKEGNEAKELLRKSPLAWMSAISLSTKKPVLIPAQLAHIGFAEAHDEQEIRHTTSNGAAAGTSWEMASYNAICEAVERDSFLIHWLHAVSPPRINIENVADKDARELYQALKRRGNVHIFDITTDIGIPTALTLLTSDAPGRMPVFVSPKTDLDLTHAIRSSLFEALRAGLWPDALKSKRTAALPQSLEERRQYWSDKKLIREVDFLFHNQTFSSRPLTHRQASWKEKMGAVKDLLKTSGTELYLADIASKRAKRYGLHIAMAVSPDLYPLYLNESHKYLHIDRLLRAPAQMGIVKRPPNEASLNQTPHPML